MGTPSGQLGCCTFQDCMVPAQHPGSAYPNALSRLHTSISGLPYVCPLSFSTGSGARYRTIDVMSAGSFSAILAAAVALLLVASTAGGRPLAGKSRMP